MKAILQLNAAVGVASSMAATALIELVLTKPTEVASAVAQHEYGAVVAAVVTELAGWVHALLRFL
jgi:hypothetical protein